MWGGLQVKQLNTREELELELAAYQAEAEKQAELVPGPNHDQSKNFNFFKKTKPTPLLVQHEKGQPDSSTNVREKGCVKKNTNRDTPCRWPS